MSIKHVLLAFLSEQPAHGYELKRQFDEAIGSLWPVQQAQIYNNLRLLEKDGLIELETRVVQENLPDRKNFRVTELGRRTLAAWATSPVHTSRQLKDDLYLKLTTLTTVLKDHEALSTLVWQQRAIYLQHLRELERALAEAETNDDAVTAALLEGAILHAEADLAWLDRCEARLLAGGGP
jgi:DNA-binding PadR family transcriptional regulator